jgi:hypothetical protein
VNIEVIEKAYKLASSEKEKGKDVFCVEDELCSCWTGACGEDALFIDIDIVCIFEDEELSAEGCFWIRSGRYWRSFIGWK